MNYIIYNGIRSDKFSSLIIKKLPNIIRAAKRYETTKIDGRDGAIYRDLGYDNTTRTMQIGIKNYTEIDKILAWLSNEGKITFSNEPDKVYYARFYNAIDVERFIRFGETDVKMICDPYKYLLNEGYTSGLHVNNVGTVLSLPLMKITGMGTTHLMIDGKEICKLVIDEYIEIDSEKEECSKGSELKNRNMLGNFPSFSPGPHTISFDGGEISSCRTLVRSRFV